MWTYRVLAGMRWVPLLLTFLFLVALGWTFASGNWRGGQTVIGFLVGGVLGNLILWVICSVGMAVVAGAHAQMGESIARQDERMRQDLRSVRSQPPRSSSQTATKGDAMALDDQNEQEKKFFSRG
ncbi:MAG: hypothetical protein L6R48_19115 [Planctomycetes bacterium]|nr:hypothetical protein [Planctomycetota bacterium]